MSAGTVQHVEETLAGSELGADVTGTGATTITVDDPTDFQPDGGELQIGGVEKGYATVDDTTGVITLDAAIGTVYLAGEPVYALPLMTERFAHVLLEDDEETLQARVPHGLFDRLPVGARDANLDELELVELSRDGTGELFVLDVLEREPIIDGTYIDPTTLPPPAVSDGSPPSTSPTPTIIGLIQSLFVTWVGIANADLVSYEVHLSTSSGFTPSSGTYAGETNGTRFVIGALPGTTNKPLPGTTYFVKLVAKDEDGAAAAGAEASGTPATVTSPDIAAESVIAGKLAAGSVLAGDLEAELAMLTRLIIGDPTAGRLELGQLSDGGLGLVAFDPAGVPTVGIDGPTGDAYIRGEFEFGVGSRLTSLGGTDILELQQAPSGSFAQVAPVQTSAGGAWDSSGLSNLTRIWAADVQAGNLILICWVGYYAGGAVSAPATPLCKDAAGGVVSTSPTLLEDTLYNPTGTENIRQTVYAIQNAPASIRTVSVTSGANQPRHGTLAIHEFSGVALSGATDKEKTPMASGSSRSPTATASAANAQADELTFGCIAAVDTGGLGAPSNYSLSGITAGYAARSAVHSTSWFHSLATSRLSSFNYWKRETAVVTSAFAATVDGGLVAPYWLDYVVTFKAQAAGVVAAQTDHVRLFAKDVSGEARAHVVDEAAVESALVLGTSGEVWRLEYVAASINPPSTAAASAMTAQTVSIASLAVGDLCFILSHDVVSGAGGFKFYTTAVIGTAGQVTVNGFNADDAVQDPGATTLHFLIIHRS